MSLVKVCLWSLLALSAIVFGDSTTEYNDISRGLNPRNFLEKITSSLMTTRTDGSSSQVAKEQVLSLNLSNLLILVLLKALIFAAGSIGAGNWKGGYGYGRSADDSENGFITDTEILLYLGYLAGKPGKYQCLQNIACNRPQLAMQYAKAGRLLIKASHFVPNMVEIDPNHEQTVMDLKKAAEFGLSGGICDKEFVCGNNVNN